MVLVMLPDFLTASIVPGFSVPSLERPLLEEVNERLDVPELEFELLLDFFKFLHQDFFKRLQLTPDHIGGATEVLVGDADAKYGLVDLHFAFVVEDIDQRPILVAERKEEFA